MTVEGNSSVGSNVVTLFGAGDGGGGTIGGMEERVEKLEGIAEKLTERLGAIDVKIGKIETRLEYSATKADVSEAKASVIMWVVGTVVIAQLLPHLPEIVTALKSVIWH